MDKVKGKRFNQWVQRTFIKVKGRKEYICDECEKVIPKGTVHYKHGTFPGTARVHRNCFRLIDNFLKAKCRSISCRHNLDGFCSREMIDINSSGFCENNF